MLSLNKITVRFTHTAMLERAALRVATLNFAPRSCTAIIGSNGAGKTTLLKVICGQIRPTSGTITVDNQDTRTLTAAERARIITTVAQDPRQGTFEQLSIYENMVLAAARGAQSNWRSIFSRSQKNYFADRLSILNMDLQNRLDTPVSLLSGGQRQALSLVMATLTTPKVLLLDEPTAALDPRMATRLMDIVAALTQDLSLTTIMITHQLEHAAQYAQNIVVMDAGEIAQELNNDPKGCRNALDLAQYLHKESAA